MYVRELKECLPNIGEALNSSPCTEQTRCMGRLTNPSIEEVGAGKLEIQGHPWLPSQWTQGQPGIDETQSQKI